MQLVQSATILYLTIIILLRLDGYHTFSIILIYYFVHLSLVLQVWMIVDLVVKFLRYIGEATSLLFVIYRANTEGLTALRR